jgi:hypothetical protein
VTVGVTVGEGVLVPVAEGVAVLVRVGLGVDEDVALAVGEGVAVGTVPVDVADGEGVRVAVGVSDGEEEAVDVAVAVAADVGVEVNVDVGDRVDVSVAAGVGEEVDVAEAAAVVVAVAGGVGVAVGTASGTPKRRAAVARKSSSRTNPSRLASAPSLPGASPARMRISKVRSGADTRRSRLLSPGSSAYAGIATKTNSAPARQSLRCAPCPAPGSRPLIGPRRRA